MLDIKENITYLFGAGASASIDALPLNDKLVDKILEELILTNINSDRDSEFFNSKTIEILNKAKELGNLDTYAIICKNNGNDNFNTIKQIIWLYFTYMYNKSRLDKRYLKLLPKICITEKGRYPKINPKVNILSWNYDLQIEESFKKFSDIQGKLGVILNAYPNFELCINNPDQAKKEIRDNEGALIHLNGVAGYSFDNGKSFADEIGDLNEENIVERNKKFIRITSRGVDSHIGDSINFAWDKNAITTKGLELAKNIAQSTIHLVIIGYSFPELNRDIDTEIIQNMSNLKTITFQTDDEIAIRRLNDILTTRDYLREIKIDAIANFTEFYVPIKL